LARRLGSTEGEIEAVLAGRFDGFAPAWSAALRAADRITSGDGRLERQDWSELTDHWQPAEIVEIVAVAAAFNLFNRFANALEIPPTR
jgi:alkylhydroperoxidase family enzyme